VSERSRPGDAVSASWVDRAPAFAQPYLRLSRFDRPIGFWLLVIPCWQGQFLGRVDVGFGWLDLALFALFAIGAIAMRGAGCTYNDVVDAEIDAKVARTTGRPIPSGQVSKRQALIWIAAQCLIGLCVLLALPQPAQIVALCAIPLVAAYPFMKRITWWPQAWLGLTFNWGILVGYAAVQGQIDAPALLLYASAIAWTIGYDTIYALQDIEDDAMVGVRSTARLFGANAKIWVSRFYVASAALAFCAALAAGDALWFVVVFALYGAMLWKQADSISVDNPKRALTLFQSNREAGLVLASAFFVQALVPWLLEGLFY
jgi:4-hydroxybenzoate polyprenyltransferase